MLQCEVRIPMLRSADGAILAALARVLSGRHPQVLLFVSQSTLLRWSAVLRDPGLRQFVG